MPSGRSSTRHLDPEVADQVLRWVTAARWFGGKGRRALLIGVTRLPWLTPGSTSWPAVRFVLVEIAYPDQAGATDLYSLAVAYWPTGQPGQQHAELARLTDPDLGPVVAYDATQDPAACRVLLNALLIQRGIVEGEQELTFHLGAPGGLTADLEPRMFRGEQSNTSVMLGEVAILKLFRRLELGRNLDIEVHDALLRSGLADVARLYGWVSAAWPHRGRRVQADLAMVVEQLPDAHDGWGLALASARAGSPFAAAAQLGTVLAETHAGLRDAFPTGSQPGAELASRMSERLAIARQHAPQLDSYVAGLERLFAALADRDLATQRVHGDFHLGQTLHTPAGWKIIDFEGEPAKSLAERRSPDSVWRDVAGMRRSFGYAAASIPGPRPTTWAAECQEAFLSAYAGGRLDPDQAAILRAYEADKAVYEVVYEVRNRPDWVGIPLAAVATLADSASTSVSAGPSDPQRHGEGVARWHSTPPEG